jgi:hypothetical protein
MNVGEPDRAVMLLARDVGHLEEPARLPRASF